MTGGAGGVAAPEAAARRARAVLVLPSLRTSGGVMQALAFAGALREAGCASEVWSMWQAPSPVPVALPVTALGPWAPRGSTAAVQLPWLAASFARACRALRDMPPHHVFTHYSTLPLARMVPAARRWLLVQDLEWHFMPQGWRRDLVRGVFLRAARRSRVVAANDYLADALRRDGIEAEAVYPIWADAAFAGPLPAEGDEAGHDAGRDIDVLFVLRKGHAKQLDTYFDFHRRLLEQRPGATVVAVTPDEALRDAAQAHGLRVVLRPSRTDLQALYRSARCFVLLSRHEGFALPPLEAMGSGCVPVCLDSGGPRSYLGGELATLLVPVDDGAAGATARVEALLGDAANLARLSRLARTAFGEGLESTRLRRDRAVAQVAAAMLRDTPR